MIPWLSPDDRFPPVERAREEPNGQLAAGADLSLPRLLDAYRSGIFPWYSEGQPLLWWSPDPRMVLFPPELKLARSLKKRLARRDYEMRTNTAFEAVIRACAAPRAGQDGTWITEEVVAAYTRLNRAGHAHSVETWIGGELAGGLYGVAIVHERSRRLQDRPRPPGAPARARRLRHDRLPDAHRAPCPVRRARDPARGIHTQARRIGKLSSVRTGMAARR
jgi:hypothetical protein